MAYTPRRRGPNKSKVQAGPDGDTIAIAVKAEPVVVPKEAIQPTRRRKRADLGGFHLKLSAPTREGFQRRWVNDEPGRLAMFQELAYDHVSESGIKSDSPDSRVRRFVGTQEGGLPQYAYLMETPLSEFQAGIEEKEESRRSFEDAIRRGEDTMDQPITAKVQSHESSIR